MTDKPIDPVALCRALFDESLRWTGPSPGNSWETADAEAGRIGKTDPRAGWEVLHKHWEAVDKLPQHDRIQYERWSERGFTAHYMACYLKQQLGLTDKDIWPEDYR